MILSFKERFKGPIKKGVKIHTIREDRKNRWIPGRKIHFSTGVRTKYYECFKQSDCTSTQEIEIIWFSDTHLGSAVFVKIDGKILKGVKEIEQLAINDGFKNINQFTEWFNEDLKGKIIHWTNFKY